MGILTNILLFIRHESTYHEIQKNPRARAAMHDDPGVQFMRKGWRILVAIIIIIYLIGWFSTPR